MKSIIDLISVSLVVAALTTAGPVSVLSKKSNVVPKRDGWGFESRYKEFVRRMPLHMKHKMLVCKFARFEMRKKWKAVRMEYKRSWRCRITG